MRAQLPPGTIFWAAIRTNIQRRLVGISLKSYQTQRFCLDFQILIRRLKKESHVSTWGIIQRYMVCVSKAHNGTFGFRPQSGEDLYEGKRNFARRENVAEHRIDSLLALRYQRIHRLRRAGIHVAASPSGDIARTTRANTNGSYGEGQCGNTGRKHTTDSS